MNGNYFLYLVIGSMLTFIVALGSISIEDAFRGGKRHDR
ncbi:hypothetical protein BH09PSE4_BH09PSE4_10440 [soil metagenome]